ncbi:hypothetical protein jhhlp_008078 [Lomentospora prolificans]|uniref:Kinase n=1 Tax=Lomentospora prolificans TaxID=41688 RepID=A0A2N3MZF3_9PEZI|nr:hypothetical protein jhhlp_008078 [Lomentospora prolificans]
MSSPAPANDNAAPAASLSTSLTAGLTPRNQDSPFFDVPSEPTARQDHGTTSLPSPISDASTSMVVDNATTPIAKVTTSLTMPAASTSDTSATTSNTSAPAHDGPNTTPTPSPLGPASDDTPVLTANLNSSMPTQSQIPTPAVAPSPQSHTRLPSMPDTRTTSDSGPLQNKRPQPPAFLHRQHGSSLLTQALATARGIPQQSLASSAATDDPQPPTGTVTKTQVAPDTKLTLPYHPASFTRPSNPGFDVHSRNHQDDLSQEAGSSLTPKAAKSSESPTRAAPACQAVPASTTSTFPTTDIRQLPPSSTSSVQVNPSTSTMFLGNHSTMLSTLGSNPIDRFEREMREIERQKAALNFSATSDADNVDAPPTSIAADRASTFPARRESIVSDELQSSNIRRPETRYSIGPEKMWSIGSDDLDGEQDGHVEKSVAKAMSKAEPNNRSRKASHTLGFFREGLPDEKTKKKDGKAVVQNRDKSATRAQTLNTSKDIVLEESLPTPPELEPPVANTTSETMAEIGHGRDELLSTAQIHDKPQVGNAVALQDLSYERQDPVGDVDMSHPGESEGEPSSRRRGSTDSTGVGDQQDGDDSGEEKISSAFFLPHQDPQGTDDEKCGIPTPRPMAKARSQSRSQDYKSWLVKAGEPEPEDRTPPPTPPTAKASLTHRHVPIAAEGDAAIVCGEVAMVDEPESTNRDSTGAIPQPGLTHPDEQSRDNLYAPKQPLEAIELIPYKHQVGGHTTIWRFSKRAVCKQLNNRENEFYETVERYHRDLLPFLPRYVKPIRGAVNAPFFSSSNLLYIGVLNVTFHKLSKRKATPVVKNGDTVHEKNGGEDSPARIQADSTNGAAGSAAKDPVQAPTGHGRVVSQSFANAPVQIPTVTFDDNRHIIPRNLLQPELSAFPAPRYRSISGSGSFGPNGQLKTWTHGRPSLDMRTKSWGATMVNKKLRNEVFNDAFLKQPVAVQKHRRPHRRPPVPRPSGVPNHPPLRPAISDSRLPSLEHPSIFGSESIASELTSTVSVPAHSNLRHELTQPSEMQGIAAKDAEDADGKVKDITGTSAPEPETLVDKVLSQKRKRRYSGSGLRRKPQVGSDSRGDLKYFEEADQVSYQDEETATRIEETKPLAIPNTSSAVGHRLSGLEYVQSPTSMPPSDFEPGFKIPRPINPKEAQTQRDSRVDYFLLLEDLTAGMKRPCIMDLKMGTRQYGVDATPKKRESQKGKCARTTSRELGVRVCGLQVWDVQSQTYIFRDKYEGRRLKAGAEFQEALTRFLYNGVDYYSILKHIPTILRKLDELERIVKGLRGYRFYAASLLMFYDGDTSPDASDYDTALDDSTTDAATDADDSPVLRRRKRNKREVDFKIADFANSITAASKVQDRPCPPQYPEDPDRGFLRGLSSLRKYFLKIQRDTRAELGIEPLPRPSRLGEMMAMDDEDEGFVSE